MNECEHFAPDPQESEGKRPMGALHLLQTKHTYCEKKALERKRERERTEESLQGSATKLEQCESCHHEEC